MARRPSPVEPDRPDLPGEPRVLSGEHDTVPRQLELSGIRLERVRGTGLFAPDARLRDCVLDGCDFAGLRARGLSLHRVAVQGGRLSGADLTDSRISDVLVRGCRADLASFGRSRLERVRFEDCDLREADFGDLRADAVILTGCDLSRASFAGSRFTRAEIRGCTLDGIAGVAALRGVGIPLGDVMAAAPVLAAELGIRIVD